MCKFFHIKGKPPRQHEEDKKKKWGGAGEGEIEKKYRGSPAGEQVGSVKNKIPSLSRLSYSIRRSARNLAENRRKLTFVGNVSEIDDLMSERLVGVVRMLKSFSFLPLFCR